MFCGQGILAEKLTFAQISLYDDDMDEPVVIERDGGEPNPDGTLTAPVRSDNMLAELEEIVVAMLKCFKKVSVAVMPNKRRQEELTYTIIPHILALRMAEYPTTFAEDQVLLTRPETTGRLRMAIQIRLSEKLLLQEAMYRFSLMDPAERMLQDANGPKTPKKARMA
jgi:N-lysine methyltransferase SETD6